MVQGARVPAATTTTAATLAAATMGAATMATGTTTVTKAAAAMAAVITLAGASAARQNSIRSFLQIGATPTKKISGIRHPQGEDGQQEQRPWRDEEALQPKKARIIN